MVRTKDWGTEQLTDADLEGQFDLIINWVMAAFNATTGHAHEGTSNKGTKITVSNLTLTSGALGDIVYHNGTNLVRLAGNTTTTKKFLNQTGDGAASAAPAWAALVAADLPSGSYVKHGYTESTGVATGTTALPQDDTIPQNTEGDEYMTLAFTPTNASNILKIDVVLNLASAGGYSTGAALFKDTDADALAAAFNTGSISTGNEPVQICFTHYMVAGSTSSITFKVRVGSEGSTTITFNGKAGGRIFGGKMASSITVTEIKA